MAESKGNQNGFPLGGGNMRKYDFALPRRLNFMFAGKSKKHLKTIVSHFEIPKSAPCISMYVHMFARNYYVFILFPKQVMFFCS